MSASGEQDTSTTTAVPKEEIALELVQEVYTPTRKAPDRIALLPKLNKAAMLIEGVLTFHALPSLSPLPVQAYPALRGVTTFSLDSDELNEGGKAGSARICAFKKRTVHLIRVTNDGATHVRELPLRGGAHVSVFRRSHACIADAENYSIIDLNEAVALPLLPISQMPNIDERPASMSSISAGQTGNLDPRQRPAVACVAENEFLIASHTGNTTLGVFVTESGEPCRGTLEWASNLRSLVVDSLYSIALLHNNTIEIHSLHTQEIAQVVSLPTSTSPTSIQPRSLIHSATGLDLGSSSGANKLDLVPVPLLPSALASDAPSTPTRPRHRESSSAFSVRDAVHRGKGKAALTTTLIVGKNSLYGLTPLTLVAQADALLEKGRVEDALSLADQLEKASGSIQENPELGYVYLRAAYIALASTLFQDAFDHFSKAQCDPRLVIRMFPDLRHPLISARDETAVCQGVQAEVLDAKSIDDYILAKIKQEKESIKQADGEDVPPTIELRSMLKSTARASLLTYLRGWRRARKAGAILGANDSRKVDIVVDTTLARLLAESHSTEELLALLNGPNDCVLPSLEPSLIDAGLYQLLASLLLQRGEITRTLEIWTKLVDGEYEDPDFADGLQRIFDLLWSTKDQALVERFGIWILGHDRTMGLQLFSDSKQTLTFDTQKILDKMQAVDKEAADLYLEGAVLQERDTDSRLHADLIKRYIDRLSQMLSEPATKQHLRQQETEYAALREQASGCPPTFLAYLISRYSAESELALFDRVRLKTILFLRASTKYDVAKIKKDLDDMELQGLRGLTLERAIVYGKLALDRQALSLLLNGLHDLASAEIYTRQAGDPLCSADVASAAAVLTLPTAKRPSRRSSINLQSAQDGRASTLARLLVELCLNENQDVKPNKVATTRPEDVARILETQATRLDTLEILSALPNSWSLSLLSPFLNGVLRRSSLAQHEASLLKALASSQNMTVSEPLLDRQLAMGPTLELAPPRDDGGSGAAIAASRIESSREVLPAALALKLEDKVEKDDVHQVEVDLR